MSSEQVLTYSYGRSLDEAPSDQRLSQPGDVAAGVPDTFLVIQHPTTPRTQPSRKARSTRRRKSSKRGGWRSSPSLTWDEVKEIGALAHEVERSGFKFTHLISIMPDAGDDMERKRECAGIVAHLGQALKRHGKPHIGLTIYEKSAVDLHAHHLVHIPEGEEDLVERLHDLPRVHVRRSVPTDIDYITKERRPLPPEFEAHVAHRRKKGARIPGKRWTATSDARVLIEPSQQPDGGAR